MSTDEDDFSRRKRISEIKCIGKVFAKLEKIEDPEVQGKVKLYALITKESVTGALLPCLDIGLDAITAMTHYRFGNMTYFALTLSFIGLPGLIAGLVIFIRSFSKDFSFLKLVRNILILLTFPLLYPIVQIVANCAMIYLMFKHKSVDIFQVLGQNVKEFKSLEGFFEAGPQFILQSFILLKGELPNYDDFNSVDDLRVLILSASIVMSFLSLAKTGFNLNRPDPDENRRLQQNVKNAPLFWFTSLLFHLVCALFRVSTLALFFANFGLWALLLILLIILINVATLLFNKASIHASCLMGTLSILMPNGYLLYKFAGVITVDMLFKESRRFLALNMASITFLFFIGIGASIGLKDTSFVLENISIKSFLNDDTVLYFLAGILFIFGIASMLLCFIHFKFSITPLYEGSSDRNDSNNEILDEGMPLSVRS